MKHFLKTALFLACGIVGGYILLVLAFCLPLGQIHNNVAKSASSFNGEYKILIGDNITTKTDDFTDALMLLTATNREDRNPLTGSIFAYHATYKDAFPHEVIIDLDNPENTSSQYSRYWHGYLVFLKPLLFFFTYDEIQIIISILTICLIVSVIYAMQKKELDKYILPYIFTIALMFPIAISISIQYISVFAIFNLSIIFILIFFDKIIETKNLFYLFLLIGMATCYFDLLTYPIVTLGLPLTIWLIMFNKKKTTNFLGNFKQICLGSLGWGIGYFGIWIGKWILGSAITRKNLFKSAIKAAASRTSTTTAIEEISRTAAIEGAFEEVFTNPICWILSIIAIIIIILLLMKKIKFNKQKAKSNLGMFIISLIPLVWYIIFANHSTWHLFFTYRTLSIFIFAILCYVASILELPKAVTREKKKNG